MQPSPLTQPNPAGMWRQADRSTPEGDASGSSFVKARFLGFLIPKAVCHSLEQLHPQVWNCFSMDRCRHANII